MATTSAEDSSQNGPESTSKSKGGGTRVFKKASPNSKVTCYIGKRDFVDHVDHIDPVAMEIEELLYEETKTLSTGVARFLLKYCLHELKDIENDLKRHHVSMKLNECIGDIVLTGTITGLDKCNKALTKLLNPIKIYIEELPNVDKRKIFISEEGRKYLDRIEIDEKVVIDMSWEDIFRTGDWRDIGLTYDKRNFQTKEGLTVSWKYGDIAREKADVLVNSANPDLMYFTECGKALAEIGGKSFIQQCRSIDNIRSGDIAYTTAGNLACKHVIHAVCCNWVKGSDNSQKTLRTLLSKILCECQQLNARSLAMPSIGTGKHKFPEEVVHQIFQEEILAFSSKNPYSSLQDIRIVIFDADKVSKMDVTSKLRKDSEIKFENVNMYLLDEDIAQEPVDAIINVLPPTLKLLGTGMMCGTILAVGGPIVQRQLDDYGEVPPGSILATSGGSMRNTQLVLHAVPSRYDEAYPSNLIERCFHIAKSRSLGTIAISVTDIETFSSSPQQLAECVLNTAENASYIEETLNVVVHVRKQATSYKEIKTWWKGIIAEKGLRAKKKTKTWNKTASQSSLVSDTLTGATSVQETRRAKLHIVARTDLCIQNSLKLIDTLISQK